MSLPTKELLFRFRLDPNRRRPLKIIPFFCCRQKFFDTCQPMVAKANKHDTLRLLANMHAILLD
jgi:hypothetical protein